MKQKQHWLIGKSNPFSFPKLLTVSKKYIKKKRKKKREGKGNELPGCLTVVWTKQFLERSSLTTHEARNPPPPVTHTLPFSFSAAISKTSFQHSLTSTRHAKALFFSLSFLLGSMTLPNVSFWFFQCSFRQKEEPRDYKKA